MALSPDVEREARAWIEHGEPVSWNVLAAGLVAPSAQRMALVRTIHQHLQSKHENAVVLRLWKRMRCSGATTLLRAAVYDVTQQTDRYALLL